MRGRAPKLKVNLIETYTHGIDIHLLVRVHGYNYISDIGLLEREKGVRQKLKATTEKNHGESGIWIRGR